MTEGLYIHLAVPSLAKIGRMQDRGELENLLASAIQNGVSLARYIQALHQRLRELPDKENEREK